jgi:hypothetical protein
MSKQKEIYTCLMTGMQAFFFPENNKKRETTNKKLAITNCKDLKA